MNQNDQAWFRQRLTRGWEVRPFSEREKAMIKRYLETGDHKLLPLSYRIIRKGFIEQGIFPWANTSS